MAASNSVPYSFSESVTLQTMDSQRNRNEQRNHPVASGGVDSLDTLFNGRLQSQDSFGMWVNQIMSDSPCSVNELALKSPVSSINEPYSPLVLDNQQLSLSEQVFNLIDVSSACVSSTEKSQVLVTGFFHEDYMHISKTNLMCVCGDASVPAEIVHDGVYRCWIPPHSKGQSVIHLCAILGYTWAVTLFSWSGLSLDFRDKFGWTALHWAAYYGREKMVATLLSAGAKPNLVTDPTHQNPVGCTAADLAYNRGYHGLSAYLSEKSLVEQFNDMSLAGNISGSLETNTDDPVNSENFSQEQIYMKDQHNDVEEEFFRTGRKQAEERVERSVIRVQAMFRSKKAQEDYRKQAGTSFILYWRCKWKGDACSCCQCSRNFSLKQGRKVKRRGLKSVLLKQVLKLTRKL
ncbi:calmodulin-binding transcription activator 5-like isoform X1 [Cicer arietinum]|uniref:calmodulin-binding transcription activator 5-like isoform X1 n=2 Tax=Cicer arietinum TaxID=3827 RepID=UPI00032AB89B